MKKIVTHFFKIFLITMIACIVFSSKAMLVSAQTSTGNLTITVNNVGGTGRSGALVYLFDSGGVNQVSGSPKTTDSSGKVYYTNLAVGNYAAQIEYTPTGQTPAATELWGSQTYAVVSGNTTAVTFNRMRPIADTRSGAALTLPTSSILSGSTASISLKVYSISGSYNARVSMIVDRDKVSSYDYNIPYTSCTPNTYSNLGSGRNDLCMQHACDQHCGDILRVLQGGDPKERW